MQQLLEFSARHWELCGAFGIILIALLLLELRNKLAGLPVISAQQATFLINREGAIVVDVRASEAFNKGRIVDAVNAPAGEFDAQLPQLQKYKTSPIILVDAGSQSPAKVIAALRNNGFEKVSYLQNGIAGWQNANLPLVKGK